MLYNMFFRIVKCTLQKRTPKGLGKTIKRGEKNNPVFEVCVVWKDGSSYGNVSVRLRLVYVSFTSRLRVVYVSFTCRLRLVYVFCSGKARRNDGLSRGKPLNDGVVIFLDKNISK